MAKKKAADGDAKGGKAKLAPALLVTVGLLGGGYFMGGGKGGAPAADAATAHAPTTTAPEAGEIVTLEPITLNLADNHFLKIGLALQLSKKAHAEKLHKESAKALDLAITLLGSKSFEELSSPAERAVAKEELSHQVAEAYHGEVLGIYFTEFVMQ